MPLVVCLNSNIYDENEEKRLRGEAFEASQAFVDMVLTGDEAADRPARLAVIEQAKKKPGRPKKVEADDETE